MVDLNMLLSTNFPLKDFTRSQTAIRNDIDNTPGNDEIEALRLLAIHILQPVRNHYGVPIMPSSGFRSFPLERVLCARTITKIRREAPGGSASTQADLLVNQYLDRKQHPKGEAADFEVPGVDNLDLANWIRNNLDFDQLILEFYVPGEPTSGWVHCSYVSESVNRHEALTIIKGEGARFGLG